jgi:hypothetical protein
MNSSSSGYLAVLRAYVLLGVLESSLIADLSIFLGDAGVFCGVLLAVSFCFFERGAIVELH